MKAKAKTLPAPLHQAPSPGNRSPWVTSPIGDSWEESLDAIRPWVPSDPRLTRIANPSMILALQRQFGNRAVTSLLRHPEAEVRPVVRTASAAGSAPVVQRLMVRMPNPYDSGVKRAVGDAEVDEIKDALEKKGYAGKGGSHGWRDDWRFIPGERTHFYGHGNRKQLGGLTPQAFTEEITKPDRQLQQNSAMRFVACGGGAAGAKTADAGEPFGKSVNAAIVSKRADWSGGLKAAEGLVYYTREYKAVLPEIPQEIEKLEKSLIDQAENAFRQGLWAKIGAGLLSTNDEEKRKTDLYEVRDEMAAFFELLGRQPSPHQTTAKAWAATVSAFEVDKLTKKQVGQVGQLMDRMFKQVSFNAIAIGLSQIELDDDNCLGSVAEHATGITAQYTAIGKQIWDQFKNRLKAAQEATNANLIRDQAKKQKIGTAGGGGTGVAPTSFSAWENFGRTPWTASKGKTVQ